jgi:D-amino peptidase
MKVYISADIEGITGTTHWDETDKGKEDYPEFREQMTAEVVAACEGALKAGATEILVKDAHDSGRNILASRLPPEARLLRGWSGHPFLMVEGVDETFQAMLMIGYHSRGGSGTSPLSHTNTGRYDYIKINGSYVSEFVITTYTAALVNVPVVFLSGDAGLCQEAANLVPCLTSVAVKEGRGGATLNLQPQLAVERIRSGVREALSADLSRCKIELPAHFSVELRFKDHTRAYGGSFYPGASLKDANTIQFEADGYFDVLRMLSFVM